jgi:hypothetical protein
MRRSVKNSAFFLNKGLTNKAIKLYSQSNQKQNKVMNEKKPIGKIDKVAITYEMFENWIVTALEGGSNYWCYIKHDSIPNSVKEKYKEETLAFTQLIAKAIWVEKLPIQVYDEGQECELLGVIDMKSVKKGLESLCEHHEEIFKKLMKEEYDANDADVFFQYIVMNELTFG